MKISLLSSDLCPWKGSEPGQYGTRGAYHQHQGPFPKPACYCETRAWGMSSPTPDHAPGGRLPPSPLGPELEPPEVEPVPAGPEAGRLGHVDRQLEPVADPPGLMRVTAERHRGSPGLPPPSEQLRRRQRALRVHLEDPAAGGQGAQHGPALPLEGPSVIGRRSPRPHPPREIQ